MEKSRQQQIRTKLFRTFGITLALLTGPSSLSASQGPEQAGAGAPEKPRMDKRLSPDQRADLLTELMTLDEKIQLIHEGANYEGPESPIPPWSLGGAGWIPGIPRLGIPNLQMTDGRSGVANTGHLGRYATALPTPLLTGSTWDLDVAYEFGAKGVTFRTCHFPETRTYWSARWPLRIETPFR